MHSSRRRCKRPTETVQLVSAIRIKWFNMFFFSHFVHGSTYQVDLTAHDKQHAINRAPWRLFVCIFLVNQVMSRWKHPFSHVDARSVVCIPIEKGTGQPDCEIAANCGKKIFLTFLIFLFVCLFVCLFFLLLYELSYSKKRTSFLELMSRIGYF